MRDVFSVAGPVAERRGTTLLTAFGYDYVPGNVAGASAVDRAGLDARHLEVAYRLPKTARDAGADAYANANTKREPVISTGTRASLLAIGAAPHHVRRQGWLALEPSARKMNAFIVDGRARWASSIGGSEPLALPRTYPELDDVAVFMEFPGPAHVTRSVALGFSLVAGAVSRTAQGRRAMRAGVKAAARKTGGGPSADARARSGSLVVAMCRGEDGRLLSAVRLEGPTNGYTLTGHMIAWGAALLRAGAQRAAGAVGPVEAFGLERCEAELSRAGLVLSEMKELKE
jgi:hypothetical protein